MPVRQGIKSANCSQEVKSVYVVYVGQSVDWFDSQLLSQSIGLYCWFDGLAMSQSVGRFDGRLASQSVGRFDSQSVSQSVGLTVCQ